MTATRDDRLTSQQLAVAAGLDVELVEELARHSILRPDAAGFLPSDIQRARFVALLIQGGIGIETIAEAIRVGAIRHGDMDVLYPDPARITAVTHEALAGALGIDVALLGRVRLAAGLAARGADDPVQSDEQRILQLIVAIARGFHDPEAAIRIARNYGERARRIAASAIGAYEEFVYIPLNESTPSFSEEARHQTSVEGEALMRAAEELLVTAHRRHMASALLSMWVRHTEQQLVLHGLAGGRSARPPAIAFVDLSGYTQLTDQAGDELGVRLANRLVAEAEVICAAHNCEIVKVLGDGVMLRSTDPARLLGAAVDLVEALPRAGLPPAHAGIHAGPVIEQDGDYFGRTVNLAARIAGTASAGEVFASAAAVLDLPAGIVAVRDSTVQLRGVSEPVELYRITRG